MAMDASRARSPSTSRPRAGSSVPQDLSQAPAFFPSLDQSNYASAFTPATYSANPSVADTHFLDPSNLAYFNGTLTQEAASLGADTLDPQTALSFDGNPTTLTSIPDTLDPSNLSLDPMAATMHSAYPTPPSNLLHTLSTGSMHSQSPSPHHSPSPQQHLQGAFGRPRNTSESLDPSSAAYPQGIPVDWTSGNAFQGHRRKPSDTYSDVSSHHSHSNQNSPYLGSSNDFDSHSAHVSPALQPQNDQQFFDNNLNFQHINLQDGLNPNVHISPAHSLQNSPLIVGDQQPLPQYTADNDFGMQVPMMNHGFNNDPLFQFTDFQTDNSINQNAFPNLDTGLSPEGQADTRSPPEFKIDFAPPSRQPSFGPGARPRASSGNSNELQPPETSRRKRAKSDPHASRSPSPGVPNRGRSPSLQPSSNGANSLSPAAIQLPASRSPSPSGRSRSPSTASSDSRQYLLDLADPDRSASAGVDGKRQKHPATFQCHLCPKRFTRAYNLRSHLRTHTDERPFVCTICGKAFARQHDRKRHEGLHSGEKKFVCHGALKTGQSWGCRRRFARADALGRHFRSEAGRECIKPLLDEEAEDRAKTWLEEQATQQLQSAQGFVAPGPMTEQPHMPPPSHLPAVLLQMYPDLANFTFDSSGMDLAAIDEDLAGGASGGRSSFDASSGIEWDPSDDAMSDYEVGLPVQHPSTTQMLQQQQQQSYGLPQPTWNDGGGSGVGGH